MSTILKTSVWLVSGQEQRTTSKGGNCKCVNCANLKNVKFWYLWEFKICSTFKIPNTVNKITVDHDSSSKQNYTGYARWITDPPSTGCTNFCLTPLPPPKKNYIWHLTCDIWHVKCEMWNVTCEMWHVKCDKWNVTCEMWHVKCDMWNVK